MSNDSRPTAIVTGAGSGIGRAVALQLAAEGWAVVLVGRDSAKLQRTLAMRREPADPKAKPWGLALPLDLAQPGSESRVVAAALETFGRLDALCNIAAYARLASIEQTTDDHWQATLQTNLDAPFRLTRAAWPAFRRQGAAVVVNVSSMASLDPFPGFVSYACSKAALNMLTHFTAREGKSMNVRAVTIAPGAVETPMLRSAFDENTIPRDATLSPEKVAALICDCITGRRDFALGELITIVP